MSIRKVTQEEVAKAFHRNGGSVRATSKELGISRSSVGRNLKATGLMEKPIAAGTREGTQSTKMPLPKKGKIARYILTSAQNNTKLNEDAWTNVLALAKHYGAQIMVGTYTYNQNAYGKLSVKRGQDKAEENVLWYAQQVIPYIVDERVELGKGLVWCGEMNILPTMVNPLAGLESYTGRKSAIFPHAKLAMRSIPTMQGEGVKLNYTTGTITQKNYIKKREGIIAEFHHIYGALLVEVNSEGNWWVRQLNHDEGTGTMQDLEVIATNGKITTGNRIEALTFGDLHGTFADPSVVKASHDMLDTLRPKFQFLHDIMEGVSINPHARKHKDNHAKFQTYLRGLNKLETEVKETVALIQTYERPFSKMIAVDSNHDDAWVKKWLRDFDYRVDPSNAELFLELQSWMYAQIRDGAMPRDISVIGHVMRKYGLQGVQFLIADESYLICGKRIECGMHGHLGPSGRFGTPDNLSKMARKANTAHTHATGIFGGLYVAGTSAKPRWDYNLGPSAATHSHTATYSNGKRAIITMYAGQWRA
jgi:hypothetical protein